MRQARNANYIEGMMTDRQPPRPPRTQSQPSEPPVDIEALTRAVERLLRRDVKLAQERLHGGKRR